MSRRLEIGKWENRKRMIEERMDKGDTLQKAVYSVCGYQANAYLKVIFPQWWEEQHEKGMRMIAQKRVKSGRAIYAERLRKFTEELRRDPKMGLRNEAMVSLRGCGWTLEDIGRVFELTRERVRQVVQETVERESGGEGQ